MSLELLAERLFFEGKPSQGLGNREGGFIHPIDRLEPRLVVRGHPDGRLALHADRVGRIRNDQRGGGVPSPAVSQRIGGITRPGRGIEEPDEKRFRRHAPESTESADACLRHQFFLLSRGSLKDVGLDDSGDRLRGAFTAETSQRAHRPLPRKEAGQILIRLPGILENAHPIEGGGIKGPFGAVGDHPDMAGRFPGKRNDQVSRRQFPLPPDFPKILSVQTDLNRAVCHPEPFPILRNRHATDGLRRAQVHGAVLRKGHILRLPVGVARGIGQDSRRPLVGGRCRNRAARRQIPAARFREEIEILRRRPRRRQRIPPFPPCPRLVRPPFGVRVRIEGEFPAGQIGQGNPGRLPHAPLLVPEGIEQHRDCLPAPAPGQGQAGFPPNLGDGIIRRRPRKRRRRAVGPKKSQVLRRRGAPFPLRVSELLHPFRNRGIEVGNSGQGRPAQHDRHHHAENRRGPGPAPVSFPGKSLFHRHPLRVRRSHPAPRIRLHPSSAKTAASISRTRNRPPPSRV